MLHAKQISNRSTKCAFNISHPVSPTEESVLSLKLFTLKVISDPGKMEEYIVVLSKMSVNEFHNDCASV